MSKKNKLLIVAAIILIIEFIYALVVKLPGLPELTDVDQTKIPGLTFDNPVYEALVTFNNVTSRMLFIVSAIIILLGLFLRKMLSKYPGRFQAALELFVSFFGDLVEDTLGEGKKTFVALIGTLFLFLWISNIIGIVPFLEEPTKDLNVPFGCMLVVLGVVHGMAIKVKGLKRYIKGYGSPFIVMAPLNIVGELAKGVSLCFRLFGNILGGYIIVLVISYLLRYVFVPVGLSLFFGLFVGTIQAFVFSVLSLTYISVAIAD